MALCLLQAPLSAQSTPAGEEPSVPNATETIERMRALLLSDRERRRDALVYFGNHWREEYVPMLLEVLYLDRNPRHAPEVIALLERGTGQSFGGDVNAWLDWLWSREERVLPFHGDWMARLYSSLDPKFGPYFAGRTDQRLIRLDEVRWGGVGQDGIPPLRQPEMIPAGSADYLADGDVVFGISINGDHRAYPKRILAWHEMFVDEVGGVPLAGVYCTLCGTVIAYDTRHGGVNHELGTSGFLYRSNKLMYDRATQSLWSTIEGKPVIGPLTDRGIELASHAVVTTSWGEWCRLHPDTKVLSLNTGHRRDYAEGAAYRDYFATDRLMFTVPELDDRLANKAEVLIVRAPGYRDAPLAISADYLRRNRIHHDRIGTTDFVVLTDDSGGNRVYRTGGRRFVELRAGFVQDAGGTRWAIEEDCLKAPGGEQLERLPYHRIFWFAWFNAYPETRLVF